MPHYCVTKLNIQNSIKLYGEVRESMDRKGWSSVITPPAGVCFEHSKPVTVVKLLRGDFEVIL